MAKGLYLEAIRYMIQNKRRRVIVGIDALRNFSLSSPGGQNLPLAIRSLFKFLSEIALFGSSRLCSRCPFTLVFISVRSPYVDLLCPKMRFLYIFIALWFFGSCAYQFNLLIIIVRVFGFILSGWFELPGSTCSRSLMRWWRSLSTWNRNTWRKGSVCLLASADHLGSTESLLGILCPPSLAPWSALKASSPNVLLPNSNP